MRRLLRILLASCLQLGFISATGTSPVAPSNVLPQFVFGGGWYSAIYFTNYTALPVSFAVNFISNTGTPLTVPSLGGSTAQVSLAAFGTAMFEAPNSGDLVEGYAAFTLPPGVSGYGVFRASETGQPDQEAVVPLSEAQATSNTLTWDETAYTTSVAIVNPSSTAAAVAITAWDENGNIIGTSSLALPPGNKVATELRTLPGLAGTLTKRGSAQFKVSAGSVAVLGLRFGQSFTSIPTTAGAPSAVAAPSVLPQFAFGGGWYSAVYFTNVTTSPVSFPVNFISDAGTPLTVPTVGGPTAQVNLAANGTAMIEALNEGDLVEGYVAFTLPPGVIGYGVFRATVPGQPDQEAVVPLSDAKAVSNMLTWDESNLTTSVAIVNPSSTAATVDVTLWNEAGATIGTSSVALPANNKIATELRTLPGLAGMLGQRGSAQFKVSAGDVAVLGLRFGESFTSIPTTGFEATPSAALVAQRALAQTGLAIGLASTVLQSQLYMVMAMEMNVGCEPLDGGGSLRASATGATVYYDAACTEPYVATGPNLKMTKSGDNTLVVSETATYYALSGTAIGAMTLNETAQFESSSTLSVSGLGLFTPASGARTPVQLGVWCALSESSSACAGGIAQDFPELGLAIGAVTPMTLSAVSDDTAPVTFTGGGNVVTGPIGSLTLTNPSPTSLVIQGGTAFSSTTCSGGASEFVLFPPTPTSWTLTDSAHDQSLRISVTDNTTRNLTLTITQVSTGIVLASGTLDQSGSGSITYSDGTVAAVTNWTLAD